MHKARFGGILKLSYFLDMEAQCCRSIHPLAALSSFHFQLMSIICVSTFLLLILARMHQNRLIILNVINHFVLIFRIVKIYLQVFYK